MSAEHGFSRLGSPLLTRGSLPRHVKHIMNSSGSRRSAQWAQRAAHGFAHRRHVPKKLGQSVHAERHHFREAAASARAVPGSAYAGNRLSKTSESVAGRFSTMALPVPTTGDAAETRRSDLTSSWSRWGGGRRLVAWRGP